MHWGFAKEILTEEFYICSMCTRYLGQQATEWHDNKQHFS